MIAVILCGGAGARLWPASRAMYPKQFLKFHDGSSFIQKAFLRAINIENVTEIIFVTNKDLFCLVELEIAPLNVDNVNVTYILEPFMKNTAPAIACALQYIDRDDAPVLILTADHHIAKEAEFQETVKKAQEFINNGKIVTFGIVPNAPETAYGYIETNGSDVLRFVEKPSAEKANEYISAGNYLWNSGMFAFLSGVMKKEFETHAENILSGVSNILAPLSGSNGRKTININSENFAKLPAISIDYAVMEKSGNLAVIPCDIGWRDIGSWDSYGNLFSSDEQNNHVKANVLLKNTKDCVVYSDKNDKLVALLGVSDLVVADTSDALLIADKSRVQEIKELNGKIKENNHSSHKFHRTQYKPWGQFTTLQTGENFKIKHIRVYAGEAMSLQLHHHRSEHWVVVKGTAKVTKGEEVVILNSNESIYISINQKHRVENPGAINLEMIEVQCGDYLEEDDIVRFEDRYGRL